MGFAVFVSDMYLLDAKPDVSRPFPWEKYFSTEAFEAIRLDPPSSPPSASSINSMHSLRSLSRALPGCLSKASIRCSQRALSTIHRPALLQHSWKATSRPTIAAFSTSRSAWEKEGEGIQSRSTCDVRGLMHALSGPGALRQA